MSFDKNFCARRRFESHGAATHGLDGSAKQGTEPAAFIDAVRKRHAADERNRRFDAQRQREGHRLADISPGLRDHADMLLRRDDP